MRSTIALSNQDAQLTSVFFTLVTSSAIAQLSVPELCDLVLVGQSCARTYNLTDILLYRDGNFMQYLEGDETDVRRMLALSARDPRQFLITPILEGFAAQRQYPEWSMAFPITDSDDMRFIRGYSNFLDTSLTIDAWTDNLTDAQKLLLAFKMYVGNPCPHPHGALKASESSVR